MSVVVVTGGHPFDHDAFFSMWDDLLGAGGWRPLAHPDAYERLGADRVEGDVVVFYDMPGVQFTRSDPPLRTPTPPGEVIALFDDLTARGVPMLFLHHAIASWPAWDGFAAMLGARFHYGPGRFAGTDWPPSGYRFDIAHEVVVEAPDHPICAGLGPSFTLTDELYLFPVDEGAVTPLLRSRARFVSDRFYSADLAIRGVRDSREGWTHPPGSDLIGWTRRVGSSDVVYLQPGDGPSAYADANYRSLLRNAVSWLARNFAPRGRHRPPTDATRDLPSG